jgi:aspartate kinase
MDPVRKEEDGEGREPGRGKDKVRRASRPDTKASRVRTVVVKIGGSCLVSGESVRNVSRKIRDLIDERVAPVIVVSAFKGMTDLLLDVARNGHPERDWRNIDRILPEGEQLSARILQSILQSYDLKTRAILLSDPKFPIITDESYGNANVMLEETEKSVKNPPPAG